jgi:hypothetical protein
VLFIWWISMPSPPTIRRVTQIQCLPGLPCVRFAALYSFFSSIFYHFSVRLLFLVNESCGFEFHTKYERLLFRMNEWRGFQCLLRVLYLLDQSIDLFVFFFFSEIIMFVFSVIYFIDSFIVF